MAASFRLCRQNFRRWGSNPRYYIAALFCVVFIWIFAAPYARFSSDASVNISPWIFPLIYNTWYLEMVTFFVSVIIFCDAPFTNDLTPYESIRAGRRQWIFGQFLYVFITSIMLTAFLFLLSVIFLLPNVEFSAEWGKVIKTLAQTSKGNEYGVSGASTFVTQALSPIQATLQTFSVLTLEFMFIGFAMFFLNLAVDRKYGNAIGTALAFIPALGPLFANPETWWLMPTAWVNSNILMQSGTYSYPPYWYVFTVLIAGTVLFILFSYLSFKRKSIEVLSPL